ncbi:unnamed protein product [Rotaria magnacalcarata]|uniref:OmpA-like domain-containing protein n=1 Tax=Rotaria magnacalcarata TaxID=392030 RepID=A0A819P4N5_9BILA|nr:unnamed protein product [Rotaria magnacalcarata]CAF4007974.1 unnamed protein product [Rotaria magnacalcarata]
MNFKVVTTSTILLASTVLTGCCSVGDRVVLLQDDKTGKVGKVAIIQDANETVISEAFTRATITNGKVSQKVLSAAEVQTEYGDELRALPPRPISYYLYFASGAGQLTTESQDRIPEISTEIKNRSGSEVLIVGHTDTVGTDAINDKISLERAESVKNILISKGFDAGKLSTVGRGERDLLVPTPDNTPEPENRRVEVMVR